METSPDFQQLWVARGRTTKPTLVPPQFHTDYIKKGVLFLLESGVGEFREGNAPHSSTLAWKIPWTEEAGRLQSMGSRRVRNDWATSLSLSLFTFMHWRRKWQPTPVFFARRIPGMGEPGGLPSMGSHRVGHDWSDLAAAAAAAAAVLSFMVSVENSSIAKVIFPPALASFKIFSLSLVFHSLNMKCLCVIFCSS